MIVLIAFCGALLNSQRSVLPRQRWSSCFSCSLSWVLTFCRLHNRTITIFPLLKDHYATTCPDNSVKNKTTCPSQSISFLKCKLDNTKTSNEFLMLVLSSLRVLFSFFSHVRLLSGLRIQLMCQCFSNRHNVIACAIIFTPKTLDYVWVCKFYFVERGLLRILSCLFSVVWFVCYLCNQAEDAKAQGSGWLPNIVGICYIDTSAVRICQATVGWPCC